MNTLLQAPRRFLSLSGIGYKAKVMLLTLAAVFVFAFGHREWAPVELHSVKSLATYLPRLFLTARSDVDYLLWIVPFTLLLLWLARRRQRVEKVVYLLFVLVILLSILASLFNVTVVKNMGRPLSYQWLYYSDFLSSTDAQNAIKANLTPALLSSVIVAFSLLFIAFRIGAGVYKLIPRKFLQPTISWPAVILVLVGYQLLYFSYRDQGKLASVQLANPVLFFAKSAIFSQNTALFTMNVPPAYKAEFSATANKVVSPAAVRVSGVPIKNVILFVMESVSSKYLQLFGGRYPLTPTMDRLANESLLFKNAYAHTPTTPYAMVSLLGSAFPVISFKGITAEQPTLALPTLSSELKKRGYRTSFFNAGDIRFQKCDKFLEAQRFDLIVDYRSKHCRDRQFIVKEDRWDNPDGADDNCLVDSFEDWIGDDAEKTPFFSTLWTVQTHYPYALIETQKKYVDGDYDNFNKYLNAVHHSDSMLARLVQVLKKKNLYESTLIVVVGDHGESFGQHALYGHGNDIYEESMRIPLLFINGGRFRGETRDGLVGQVDIAPSVMDALNLPAPNSWVGQSLLQTPRDKNRIYFFCPWSDYLFGYREGDKKFIYNASKNLDEVYDLRVDPNEKNNLAKHLPAGVLTESHQRLAAWVQFQNDYFKQFGVVANK